jgi:D-glycero-D-manno-heptose 1,7-bisphosphate phosphatase
VVNSIDPMRKAIFLDRDGVINKAYVVDGVPLPPKSLKDVEILDGVKEATSLLIANKFILVVVTNQPDVARGTVTRGAVEEINAYLGQELSLEHFFTCFHDDIQGCDCRKPKPGLLQKSAEILGINLHESFLVGDRWRDVSAGQAVGCTCFFVDHGYNEKSPVLPFTKVSSLIEAAHSILENSNDSFS